VGLERPLAILFAGGAEFLFRQQLLRLEWRAAGIDDDIILEVDHLLQAGRLHGEQATQPARHRLEEPDVNYGGREFDVPHPLAADTAVGDFHPAAIADHPLVLHPAVLAASAFPVLLGAENPLAEQTILL